MGHLFTASNTERAMACAASVALPQGLDRPSEAARLGTDVHTFIADALTTSREEALKRTNRPKVCARIDVDAIKTLVGAVDFACEQVMSYPPTLAADAAPGRYPDDGRIWGTADLVVWNDTARLEGKTIEVFDFKTGKSVGSAAENAQLKMLALMANATGWSDFARIGIIYVDTKTGELSIDDATLTALDLNIFASEVKDAIARIEEAHAAVAANQLPVMNPGDHCKYCRAIGCAERAA